ncbi:pituitary tumor-transforming gene 1 protein-interacting protein-like [Physella acuta]|uniref:pituitary tumor-transforming gene 1 protein-interacting protein-like n=1 Tax=Physella acuta TaxID=109671 RepID=UPI0027DDE0C1|nr:pituitary tumor-transforming gene 1 protein-interacting protein-like [Physella acuta]XP_059179058.1 pituitary tumor-transforming gene 1 protein-interacting protein-like [Physella acuta]
MRTAIYCLVVGLLCVCSLAQDASTTTTTTVTTTSTEKPITTSAEKATTTLKSTTVKPEDECTKNNGSCDKCVENAKCMYCYSNDACMFYPTGKVLPPSSYCALDKARWGVCWLNFEALIISMSIIGGLILITIVSCCIYCCCCRGGNKKKYDKEDGKFESQKMERKAKQEERRSERKGRLDEIRRKYGLVKDDAPYQRFDA